MERFLHILGGLPFIMLNISDGKISVNRARIVEALIIAGITAGVTSYVTLEKMQVRFDMFSQVLTQRIERVEKNVEKTQDTFLKHLEDSRGRK